MRLRNPIARLVCQVHYTEWPGGGAWPGTSPSLSILSQERAALPAAAAFAAVRIARWCVSPGFVHWSSSSRKFIIGPLIFLQKEDITYLFFYCSFLGEEAKFWTPLVDCVCVCMLVITGAFIASPVSWWNGSFCRIWALGEIPGGHLPWPLPLGKSISERSQRAREYPWGHPEGWKETGWVALQALDGSYSFGAIV